MLGCAKDALAPMKNTHTTALTHVSTLFTVVDSSTPYAKMKVKDKHTAMATKSKYERPTEIHRLQLVPCFGGICLCFCLFVCCCWCCFFVLLFDCLFVFVFLIVIKFCFVVFGGGDCLYGSVLLFFGGICLFVCFVWLLLLLLFLFITGVR